MCVIYYFFLHNRFMQFIGSMFFQAVFVKILHFQNFSLKKGKRLFLKTSNSHEPSSLVRQLMKGYSALHVVATFPRNRRFRSHILSL